MKTGNTFEASFNTWFLTLPQWSPVMKTGNTAPCPDRDYSRIIASMEPGHEDREYTGRRSILPSQLQPQWSPVMKTGNTRERRPDDYRHILASMEPGHEDREYRVDHRQGGPPRAASMEPGHEDREYDEPVDGRLPRWGASMEPGHEDREYR